MSESKKQPGKEAGSPAADRVIPRGTDEHSEHSQHSGDDAKRDDDRAATSKPSKRDDAGAPNER